jgi:uroporphyrin-III C-methyltransferase/precorrin-2 dehydrogenase/sirohydrochlorin ferrochelatase
MRGGSQRGVEEFQAGFPSRTIAGHRPSGGFSRKLCLREDRMTGSLAAGAKAPGRVLLIGCGPGDPDLITVRAMRRIAEADVLVVDRLVGAGVLAHARADAVVIPVGKEAGGPSTPQDEINRVLVREALKGQVVARLKGGDAFVFGRAAEEIAAVRAADIDVEIVPGITAAHACAASIALPLTLRESVRHFSLVTGATADGEVNLDWPALSTPGQAFAIYMGVRTARTLRSKLLAAGASPSLPIVVVENGTRSNELAVATTLSDLVDAISAFGIRGPAIIFGGLDWEDANLTIPDKVHVYRAPADRTAGSAREASAPDAF